MEPKSIENEYSISITRREFLEFAGKSALAVGAFSTLGGILLPSGARAQTSVVTSDLTADLICPSTFFPAVAKSGDMITVRIRMPEDTVVKDAILWPEEKTAAAIHLKAEPATQTIESYTEYILKLEAAISPGLYALELLFEDGKKAGSVKRPRSVWIKENFSDSFTFVILADYHVGDNRGKKTAPKMDFTLLRSRILKEVAAVKPEFVLFAGDITYSPGQYAKDYNIFCNEIISGLNVPVFVTPGNHDLMNIVVGNLWNVQGHDYWHRHIGSLYNSFSYGRYRFIGMNTYDRSGDARDVSKILSIEDRKAMWNAANGGMRNQQYEWIKAELDDAKRKDQIISVFGHHTPLDDMEAVDSVTKEVNISPERFVKTLQDSGVRNYYYGHKHTNQYDERDLLAFTCTGTSGSDLGSDDGWGFRIVDVKGNRFDSRYVEVEPHPKRSRIPAGSSVK